MLKKKKSALCNSRNFDNTIWSVVTWKIGNMTNETEGLGKEISQGKPENV